MRVVFWSRARTPSSWRRLFAVCGILPNCVLASGRLVAHAFSPIFPGSAPLVRWPKCMGASFMLRVLHVVHALDPGGAERLVIEMIRGMQNRVDSFVCCLDRAGDWAPEVQSLGVPVKTLVRKPGFHPLLGRKIAEIAREHRIDVLHCHQYSPFVYGSFARLLHPRLKLVFTEHGRLADAHISWRR